MTAVWERSPGWGVVDRPDDGEHGGTVYAAPLDTGVVHVLRGPAAVVCRVALTGRDRDAVRQGTAEALGTDAGSVDDQALQELLDDLVRMGLLRRVVAAAGSATG